MLGPAAALTLATLAGLGLGLAREWLVIASWGVGTRSDELLVALLLPEAVRTMLGGGLLSAAALPLWQATNAERRRFWLAGQLRAWLLIGVLAAAALAVAAPMLARVVGSGAGADSAERAAQMLGVLAWALPGLFVHALLTVPMQADERFVLPGLGSVLFNSPPVLYLALAGSQAEPQKLAWCFVAGSSLMAMVLLPFAWSIGCRPFAPGEKGSLRLLLRRIAPLLASSAASQGLVMLERTVASWLGDGAITLVNLARKLIGLPLVALMSLNQVLLQQMSARAGAARMEILKGGLDLCSTLTLPSMVFVAGAAPALIALLLPGQLEHGPLPALLAVMSASLVFGCWNALLARFRYAGGDTQGPLRCELAGSAAHAILLLAMAKIFGIFGFAMAALGGTLVTAALLTRMTSEGLPRRLMQHALVAALLFAAAYGLLFLPWRGAVATQLTAALLAALVVFAGLLWSGRQVRLSAPESPGIR